MEWKEEKKRIKLNVDDLFCIRELQVKVPLTVNCTLIFFFVLFTHYDQEFWNMKNERIVMNQIWTIFL